MTNEFLNYYSTQSNVTDPGKHTNLYQDLPHPVTEIVKVVQGLVIDKDLLGF